MNKAETDTKEIEAKNSRSILIFGIIVVVVGILQSIGFIHDFRQILVHLSKIPLKEMELASQAITKSTSLSIGPFIIVGGIVIIAIGRIADIGAVYRIIRGGKK
jgi:uncharacterized membrane protein